MNKLRKTNFFPKIIITIYFLISNSNNNDNDNDKYEYIYTSV